jgi:Calcineurin-like phosphoesterase
LTKIKREVEEFHTAVIYSDEQWPYEDKRAVAVVDKIVLDIKPQQLVLIGDQCDFASLSRFVKHLPPSRAETLIDEVTYYRNRIDDRNSLALTVGAKVSWTMGNHEARLHKYLELAAPQAFELFEDALSFRNLLDVPSGWDVYEYGDGFWVGKRDSLWVTHGHLTALTGPQRYLRTYGHSGVTGHTHRAGVTYSTTRIRTDGWWEIGHLSDESRLPKAAPVNSWQQAAAVVTYSTVSPRFSVELVNIVDGEALFRGKRY